MRTSLKLPGPASWFGGLLLLVLTFSAYAPAMRGGFIWDDDLYAANPLLAQPAGLHKIWTFQRAPETYYREFPVVYTTFWLERRLWGLETEGFHLVNILLHVLNAILAWHLLKRLGLSGAWLAAAIFALHPVHLESVAWITERKNVLSGFFYLSALCGYLEFEEIEDKRWYAASLLLFALALLSKSVTCTFPVIVLLLRWGRGLDIRRRDVQHLIPFFLLAFGMGLFTLWVEVPQGSEMPLTFLQRVLLACRAVWFYPMKLAWPANLSFSYERWTIDPRAAGQWLWAAASIGAGVLMWRFRRALDRGLLTGVAFYVLTISPLLGFTNIYTFRYSFAADHYQYLASLGLIAIFVGGLTKILGRRASLERGAAGIVFAAALLSALGAATWRQAHVYRDAEAVWRDVLAKNPGSWIAHNNLGTILLARGDAQDAIRHYDLALQSREGLALTHYNLGLALAGQGRYDEAIRHYESALAVQPNYPEARDGEGLAFARQGILAEAIRQYGLALQDRPDLATARNNLGTALAAQGNLDEAIRQYGLALSARPAFAAARNNMGVALARQGKADAAVEQYGLALAERPDYVEARVNLADALIGQGKMDGAIRQYGLALADRPDYAPAHAGLGLVLAGQGKLDEAIRQYQLALSAGHDDPELHNNWGAALVGQGRRGEAIGHFRRALQLDPGYGPARDNLAILLKLSR